MNAVIRHLSTKDCFDSRHSVSNSHRTNTEQTPNAMNNSTQVSKHKLCRFFGSDLHFSFLFAFAFAFLCAVISSSRTERSDPSNQCQPSDTSMHVRDFRHAVSSATASFNDLRNNFAPNRCSCTPSIRNDCAAIVFSIPSLEGKVVSDLCIELSRVSHVRNRSHNRILVNDVCELTNSSAFCVRLTESTDSPSIVSSETVTSFLSPSLPILRKRPFTECIANCSSKQCHSISDFDFPKRARQHNRTCKGAAQRWSFPRPKSGNRRNRKRKRAFGSTQTKPSAEPVRKKQKL